MNNLLVVHLSDAFLTLSGTLQDTGTYVIFRVLLAGMFVASLPSIPPYLSSDACFAGRGPLSQLLLALLLLLLVVVVVVVVIVVVVVLLLEVVFV